MFRHNSPDSTIGTREAGGGLYSDVNAAASSR